jgi:hypothetical protein
MYLGRATPVKCASRVVVTPVRDSKRMKFTNAQVTMGNPQNVYVALYSDALVITHFYFIKIIVG